MKIGDQNFNQAVEIIANYQSQTTVSFNVPINGNYSNVYPILLKEACPGLVNSLLAHGYSIGICDRGAYVDKY